MIMMDEHELRGMEEAEEDPEDYLMQNDLIDYYDYD